MPDPKLKTAVEEIRAVLKRHDIAAMINLGSQTHSEFLLVLDPTWSCMWMESPGLMRIRSKRVDYPSKAAQEKVMEDSIGLITGFQSTGRTNLANLDRVLVMLAKAGVDFTGWNYSDD
jgi:hypothetical protein